VGVVSGQDHVSNFYIVDLENFATASRRYTGDIHNSSVVGLFMTPIGQWKRLDRVMVECTRLLHIAPIVTLQLHNFDLSRTCRTSSFCTVAWQLARFQLTRRIARSLSDSWASCSFRYRPIHSQKFFWNAKCRLKQANLVSLWHEVEEPSTGTVTVNKKPVLQSFVQVIAEPDSLLVVVNRYGVKEIDALKENPIFPNGKWVVEACFVAELGGVVVRISVQLV